MNTLLCRLRRAHKSLTIWVNGILLAALPVFEYAKDSLPQIKDFLGAETYKTIGLIVVVANIALRFRTTKALDEK